MFLLWKISKTFVLLFIKIKNYMKFFEIFGFKWVSWWSRIKVLDFYCNGFSWQTKASYLQPPKEPPLSCRFFFSLICSCRRRLRRLFLLLFLSFFILFFFSFSSPTTDATKKHWTPNTPVTQKILPRAHRNISTS